MKQVSTDVSFPKLESNILNFWREDKTFERSLDPYLGSDPKDPNRKPRPEYIFYDGPPFATGLPHYGHILAGTIKDVIGRFFTMKGYHVDRRFGWDCHGVPIEFEIQKNLQLHGAKAIREFGVDKFNEECRKIVLRYTKEWRQLVERSGRWVDFEREYRTMDLDFMESIWWVIKSLYDRGLIYEGLKCVAYSTGMNTVLSNFEVNLNYKMVQDPAVTVRAKITSDVQSKLKVSLPAGTSVYAYVWTTTPWTLPGNMAIAVGPELEYSLVLLPAKKEAVIVASALAAANLPEIEQGEGAAKVLCTVPGSALLGLEYEQFFPYFEFAREKKAFRFYPGDFVTANDGTGLVHLASYGEDDLAVFQREGIAVIDYLDEDGKFQAEVPDLHGVYFKDADSKIIAKLKDSGKLVQHRTIDHSYPFCWRTDTPLLYRSVSSWFVRVEQIRDVIIRANSGVHWVPEHIRDGRFGKWLEGARDWAISRDRFWGNPIPIWRCDSCKSLKCLGSVQELETLSKSTITDLHSHFVDQLHFGCEKCSGTMRRIPQVLDCWFESGSMPYAQAHYPFENKAAFEQSFPADFIAEGLDQTRGWFYTLIVISTALFGESSFKNVIVNGIILAEDGKKMSKSLKNYPPPDEVMEEFGSDAMRLYLLASAATRAEDLRFSKDGVKQVVRQNLLPLWNAYNFFVTYALVDGWEPSQAPKTASENLLDRWILSKLGSLIDGVDKALSNYHLYAAAPPILEFIDQLTNWYIRLNRRRFWAGNSEKESADKAHAYATLHKVLVTFVRVLAPLAPFVSEEIYANLGRKDGENESVHLQPFPTLSGFQENEGIRVDENLLRGMELFEEVILLVRGLRNDTGRKVRQPLQKLTIIYPKHEELSSLQILDAYVKEELNLKEVEYSTDEAHFVRLRARLNTKNLGKVLGPKLGREGMKRLQSMVENLPSEQIKSIEGGESILFEGIEIGTRDILVERTAVGADQKHNTLAAASSGQISVVLDTEVTEPLYLEGLAREFVNRVQKLRKDYEFQVTDRIVISYLTACDKLPDALRVHGDYIKDETLALEIQRAESDTEMSEKNLGQHPPVPQEIEGKMVIIGVTRTS